MLRKIQGKGVILAVIVNECSILRLFGELSRRGFIAFFRGVDVIFTEGISMSLIGQGNDLLLVLIVLVTQSLAFLQSRVIVVFET